MKKTKPIILVSLIALIFIAPSSVFSSGPIDGVWIGTQLITVQNADVISGSRVNTVGVFYQENDTTLYLNDNVFGTIRLIKNGIEWRLFSSLTTRISVADPDTGDIASVEITIESAAFVFDNNSDMTGTLDFVANDITGTSTFDLTKLPCQELENGTPIENLASDDGTQLSDSGYGFHCYRINLPSDAKNLKIRTWGGQGDADIQVFNYRPEFDMYLSVGSATDEQVTIPTSSAGSWYVLVFGDFSDVNLKTTYDDVEAFVTRFYRLCLGREPDASGLQYWVDALLDETLMGSNVAYGFIFSPEFINANTTDEEYVAILYQAFFNRDPDIAGFNNWMAALADGRSREYVLNGFIYAAEFNQLCQAYGIIPNPVSAFVTRFYQLCLSRDPDPTGLANWTNSLLNQTLTGADVAHGFIDSKEFTEKNTTTEEYLTILYKAFFNRDPDTAGLNSWLAEFDAGKDGGFVLDGFLYSQEFSELCKAYGINPY